MRKKSTITLDEEIYECLQPVIGSRNINRFIEDLVRAHLDLEASYRTMEQDEAREAEAKVWAEGLVGEGAQEIW